jgi:hypothetical protein
MLSLGAVTTLALATGQPGEAAAATKTVRLLYVREAGVAACPAEPQLRAAVAVRLGYEPFAADARSALLARVFKSQSGYSATIELIDDAGASRGKRELATEGESCDEMAGAMALSMSIAIDPERATRATEPLAAEDPPESPTASDPAPKSAEPAAPAPLRPAPPPLPPVDDPPATEQPRGARVSVALGGLAMVGAAPGVAYGGNLALQRRRDWWSLGIGGRLLHSPAERVDSVTQLEVTLAAAELTACLHHSLLEYCALGLAGATWVSASGIAQPESDAGTLGGLGLRFGVTAPISPSLGVFARLEGIGVLAPVRPQVDDRDVWTAPGVVGSLAAGARADFW